MDILSGILVLFAAAGMIFLLRAANHRPARPQSRRGCWMAFGISATVFGLLGGLCAGGWSYYGSGGILLVFFVAIAAGVSAIASALPARRNK